VRTPPTLVRVGLEKDVRVLEVSLAIDMTASTQWDVTRAVHMACRRHTPQ